MAALEGHEPDEAPTAPVYDLQLGENDALVFVPAEPLTFWVANQIDEGLRKIIAGDWRTGVFPPGQLVVIHREPQE